MKDLPVGIFDSGVGGLTVVKEVLKLMPFEDVVYLGDTARVPYGIRSKETVTRYAIENTEFLLSIGIKMIIIACNTVSAVAIEEVSSRVDIPVVGVIKPGALAALRVTRNHRIGVIGTETTINSSTYQRELKKLDPDIEVFVKACPLFVPLVEEGLTGGEIAELVVRYYLDEMKDNGIDTLVLGCTHYPLLKAVIRDVVGPEVVLIDSAVETAEAARDILKEIDLLRQTNPSPSRRFFVTDSPERFRSVGERFLGQSLDMVEKVQIPLRNPVSQKL